MTRGTTIIWQVGEFLKHFNFDEHRQHEPRSGENRLRGWMKLTHPKPQTYVKTTLTRTFPVTILGISITGLSDLKPKDPKQKAVNFDHIQETPLLRCRWQPVPNLPEGSRYSPDKRIARRWWDIWDTPLATWPSLSADSGKQAACVLHVFKKCKPDYAQLLSFWCLQTPTSKTGNSSF